MPDNQFKADPAKYKRLAKPFESRAEAEAATKAFMAEVGTLREKYRIPEVCLQFLVYLNEGEQGFSLRGGAGWGDQTKQAQLAKRMFDQEFDSLCYIVEVLSAKMPKLRSGLVTDPDADDTKIIDE